MFLCEAMTLAVVTWYYFNENKKYLPHVYLLTTILYFIVAAGMYSKKLK